MLVARAWRLLGAGAVAPDAGHARAAEVDAVMSMLRQAARTLPPGAPAHERASLLEALGLCLRDLAPGGPEHNRAAALDALRRAVGGWEQAGDQSGANRTRLALAELLSWTSGPERPVALREAVGLLRAAVDRGTPSRSPVVWAEAHLLFADVLLDLSGPGPTEEVNAALLHQEVALSALPPSLGEDRLWVIIAQLRTAWAHRGSDLGPTVRLMWPLLHEALLLASAPGLARGLVYQARGELMLALAGPEQPKALPDARRALRAAREDLKREHPLLRAPVSLALGLALTREPATAADRAQGRTALQEALRLPLRPGQRRRAEEALAAMQALEASAVGPGGASAPAQSPTRGGV